MKKLLLFFFVLSSVASIAQTAAPATPCLIGSQYAGFDGIDPVTNCQQILEHPHCTIHNGKHFFYQDSITLANAASQTYMIVTPNTEKWPHITFALDGSAITQFELYEASDYVASSSYLVTAFNNNRNSAELPTTLIYKGSIASGSIGTLLKQYKSGAATGHASKTSSHTRNDDELILKQNTRYIFKATSGTADNLINIKFMWYEHIDKN